MEQSAMTGFVLAYHQKLAVFKINVNHVTVTAPTKYVSKVKPNLK